MSQDPKSGRDWESFWACEPPAGAAMTGASSVAFLDQWWRTEIAAIADETSGRRAADLACGAGKLATIMSACFEERLSPISDLICIDYSESAVRAAVSRLRARALVADLTALPVADASIDIVLSQYGIEYAGDAGIAEAARIVAAGGALLALVHDREGALAAECRENLALFDNIASTRALDIAGQVFRLGFAVDRGTGTDEAFAGAAAEMRAAMVRYDTIIRRPNTTLAMEFLRRVRRDIAIMLNRRRAYAEGDIEQWLANISGELSASRNRFAAMISAARARSDLEPLAERLARQGVDVHPCARVTLPSGASIGWRLLAHRR